MLQADFSAHLQISVMVVLTTDRIRPVPSHTPSVLQDAHADPDYRCRPRRRGSRGDDLETLAGDPVSRVSRARGLPSGLGSRGVWRTDPGGALRDVCRNRTPHGGSSPSEHVGPRASPAPDRRGTDQPNTDRRAGHLQGPFSGMPLTSVFDVGGYTTRPSFTRHRLLQLLHTHHADPRPPAYSNSSEFAVSHDVQSGSVIADTDVRATPARSSATRDRRSLSGAPDPPRRR